MLNNKLFQSLLSFAKHAARVFFILIVASSFSLGNEEAFTPRESIELLSCEKSKVEEFNISLNVYLDHLEKYLAVKVEEAISEAQAKAKANPRDPRGILERSKVLELTTRHIFLAGEPLALYALKEGVIASYEPMGSGEIFQCLKIFNAFRSEIAKAEPHMASARAFLGSWRTCVSRETQEIDWFMDKIQSCFNEVSSKSPSSTNKVEVKNKKNAN